MENSDMKNETYKIAKYQAKISLAKSEEQKKIYNYKLREHYNNVVKMNGGGQLNNLITESESLIDAVKKKTTPSCGQKYNNLGDNFKKLKNKYIDDVTHLIDIMKKQNELLGNDLNTPQDNFVELTEDDMKFPDL